jgi:hypothetical protein
MEYIIGIVMQKVMEWANKNKHLVFGKSVHVTQSRSSGAAYMYACAFEHPHRFGLKKTQQQQNINRRER